MFSKVGEKFLVSKQKTMQLLVYRGYYSTHAAAQRY